MDVDRYRTTGPNRNLLFVVVWLSVKFNVLLYFFQYRGLKFALPTA